jgi:thiol-disulfide isomerase/thioredoxin
MIKIITTAILALLLTACTSQENGEEKKFNTEKKVEIVSAKEKVETYAKNIFELTTVGGETIHVDEAENGIIFQEHREKVVFVLFFGYRCPPCLAEIPVLKKMVEEKGDKLAVIALEVQRLPEEQLKIFKDAKKLNYSILSGEHTGNSEFISYIAERAKWSGSIPFLVGITPKGEVGVVHLGGMGKNDFEKVFKQLSQ